eukprot:10957064-Ditylum_brightwellii.AAC.1
MVGHFNWLAISTEPNLAKVVNMLAKCMAKLSKGCIEAAKRVAIYVKGTRDFGITFHRNKTRGDFDAFLKFLLPDGITAISDANWGPQDA